MSFDALIRPAIFEDEPAVFAAFTTRRFAKPDRTSVENAARSLADREGFAGLATTQQVHGGEVALVDRPQTVSGHDGLVTPSRRLLLGCVAADCALVLLADARARVVGACHAGWRGAVANIAGETVRRMVEHGATATNIKAFIGPSICLESFEVGEEVAEQFDAKHVSRRPDWPKPHVDLRGALHAQLLNVGVSPEYLETSTGCTLLEEDRFHSHRRDGAAAGRMMGLIGLR